MSSTVNCLGIVSLPDWRYWLHFRLSSSDSCFLNSCEKKADVYELGHLELYFFFEGGRVFVCQSTVTTTT